MCVPSARRIFAPPSLGAYLDGLASNSDAADDRGSLGRSRSLLTLGTTLPYGGGSQCLDAARRLTKPRRTRSSATESPAAGRHAPDAGYRRHSGNVRASPVPGHRPARRTHCKALCRQPRRPKDRQSILAPQRHPENGTAPNSTHSSNRTRKAKESEGKRRDTWSDSYAGDAGPTAGCDAAHARRRLTSGSCDGPGRSASGT